MLTPENTQNAEAQKKRGAVVDIRPAIAIAIQQRLLDEAEALLKERQANALHNQRALATIGACRAAAGVPPGSSSEFPGCGNFALPGIRCADIQQAAAALEVAQRNLEAAKAANGSGRDKAYAVLDRLLDTANGRGQCRCIGPEVTLMELVAFAIRKPMADFSRTGGSVSVKSYRYRYATTEFFARRVAPGRYSCTAQRSSYWPG